MNNNEVKNYYDYLYTKKLNLEVERILSSCRGMSLFVQKNFPQKDERVSASFAMMDPDKASKTPFTTQQYWTYNLFMYPAPGFYQLFEQIRSAYRQFSNDDQPAYIQSWLNVYDKDSHLDWHSHAPPECHIWHGFYCVDVATGSYTDYRIPMVNEEIRIDSEDNLLVIGKGEGDLHRSSPWHLDNKPRVTIAFDIVPIKSLQPWNTPNHWVPL